MDKRQSMNPSIRLDLDYARIREIVEEALRMTEEFTGDYLRSKEEIFKDLEKILESRMISTMFLLNVGCSKIPDLKFRIDPKRRQILGISKLKKKVAKLNHLLRAL